MPIPLEVTFHGVPSSGALRDNIVTQVAKLERQAPDALSCRVTVEYAGQRRHKGNRYHVHVRLIIPGAEFNAGLTPPGNASHQDPYVAVRDAFEALRRQLEESLRIRRGEVKIHVAQPHGRIARLFPEAGYGIIVAEDGREIHFHRNSLVDAAFEDLQMGSEVRFTEAPGVEGPWASTVHAGGKQRATPA